MENIPLTAHLAETMRQAKVTRVAITTFSIVVSSPFIQELNTKRKVNYTRSDLHSWIMTTSLIYGTRSDWEAYKSADVRVSIRKSVSISPNESHRRFEAVPNMILTFVCLHTKTSNAGRTDERIARSKESKWKYQKVLFFYF